MIRKALSYLLLLLIVFQSLEAMADVHPTDHIGAESHSYSYLESQPEHSSPELTTKSSTSSDQNLPIDPLTDCHHHSCHFHIYLFNDLTQINELHKRVLTNDYPSVFPEAPASTLYRPPIA